MFHTFKNIIAKCSLAILGIVILCISEQKNGSVCKQLLFSYSVDMQQKHDLRKTYVMLKNLLQYTLSISICLDFYVNIFAWLDLFESDLYKNLKNVKNKK